jgi:hypothetical protein
MLTLRNEFVPKEKKLTPKFIAHMATCIDAAEQKVSGYSKPSQNLYNIVAMVSYGSRMQ